VGSPLIVADTNLIVYLLVRSQETPEAELAYARDPQWTAPELWKSEFRNALALYVRKGLIGLGEAVGYLARAERLVQNAAEPVDSVRVIALAAQSGCPAYDCEFVALAQRLGVPLVTSDRRLVAKFRPFAIHLRDFVRRARP
jgi:predicted nucleic acid-binding protein